MFGMKSRKEDDDLFQELGLFDKSMLIDHNDFNVPLAIEIILVFSHHRHHFSFLSYEGSI